MTAPATIEKIAPHHYSPDYQAMGDCRICGLQRDDNPAHGQAYEKSTAIKEVMKDE